MTYAEFKQNFLPEFLKIKSFAGKLKYASQYLTRIGSGTGRVVFDIDGEKVLKLAKNPKGIAQNEAEAGAGYYHDTQHIVTIVFDSDDDDTWLIAEKAKKVNEARIIQLTGIPSLNDLYYYLRNQHDANNGKRPNFSQEPEIVEQLNDNEWVQDLTNFIDNYAQSPGDMGRPNTFGEVLHDGQPSIVLTDYGLNDIVYDTHYAPKKQRMYELYNFQDGNDDILGDMPPQDGVDTRQAMWGLMPYSVSDGPGVINEEFLSFVENRDKYPQGIALPSTPYILDEFHNVVNNIKEVLDHVSNKKKFYGKLLELQDYLIRGKFWDREPLDEETVEINETSPQVYAMQISRDYADKISSQFAEKLGLGSLDFLGGGGYGFAYEISNNRVLKITTDVCEVDAGLKINSGKPKTLVEVYNVYKIIDNEANKKVYALIEDHIVDKPHAEFVKYSEIINMFGEDMYGQLLLFLIKGKGKNEFEGKTLNEFPEAAKIILTGNSTANISQSDRQEAYNFMLGLYAIKLDLLKLQIKSNDYMTLSNLGYKNGILTYFDIGGCVVREPQLPAENRIVLPEGHEILDEGVTREVSDKIATIVAQKYYNNTPRYIGEGVFGVAYDIGNNMVLKVTGDKSEANENMMLIGKPLEHIAKPYKVFSIKPKSGATELYVIILQKLQTNPAEFKAIKDRMDFAFKRIMDIDYPDVVDYYVNGYSPGLDVDEEMVKKYFARNPKDADFFYGVVRIGREAKEYGIESMDYVNPTNLGYMPDGSLGFFDVGFGNYFFQADKEPEEIQIDEDGSALYSSENSYGQDNFPTYDNTADKSPLTDNNIPTTVDTSIDEDLEYNHVVGDATQDKFQLTERIKSFQPGSKSVEVKKKCRLGGLGNTSVACNQGDINNLNIKPINEEIHANEVGGNFDKALKTVINGKREVCFVELNPERSRLVEKSGLRVIPVRMTSQNTMMAIVYRNSVKAHKLYDIAKSHGGYLNDKSPEEAREIGRLLGYREESIEEYIRKNQHRYGREIPRAPEPEDFNDMDEGKFDDYQKEIDVDNTTHDLDKELIRTYNDGIDVNPVYAVNGDEVRDSGFIEWVEGGNHWVDADLPKEEQKYAKHIPADELWVDDVHLSKPNDFEAILLHERTESYLIKHFGYTYDDAHDIANKIELVFREKTHNMSDEEESERISSLMFTAFKKNFKPKGDKKFSNEGVADVAAEKQFGMGQQHQGFEDKFARDQQEDVVYTDSNSDLVIIRNPKRLDSIFGYARGVIDLEGNLYIEQRPTGIHFDMLYALNKLGLVEDEEDWDVKLPHNFVTVQRYLRSNKILLGESNFAMIPDRERPTLSKTWQNIPTYEEAQPVYQRFLDKAKQKTPIFEFINEPLQRYVRSVENNAIFDPENNEMLNEAQIMSLQELPFKQEVEQAGGKIFSVGGAVRDEFLGKESKDLDVLITGVPFEQLEQILGKYGRVDAVGKSFGVLKFKPRGATEDIDIAIPRQETLKSKEGIQNEINSLHDRINRIESGEIEILHPTKEIAIKNLKQKLKDLSNAHKTFDVKSDSELPIEKDLERRDFTINAIAKDVEGNIVDPFNGQQDLKNKIIRIVNPQAFSDDPLRMLRAVQFASRFGFTIEPQTMRMIQENASRVKEIAPERILTEFDKIIKKGNVTTGAELLMNTGLYGQIFGSGKPKKLSGSLDNVKTMAEFIYLLSVGTVQSPSEFYKNNLKGDIDTFKEIKALELAFSGTDVNNPIMARSIAHNMYLYSPQALNSQIIPEPLQVASQELLQGKYPKTVNELAVNGNDLANLGLKGKEIGDMQKSLLLKVYADKVRNDKEDLLATVNQNGRVEESVADKAAERMFNVPNQSAVQDIQAAGEVQSQEEQPVEYVKDRNGRKTAIYENPRSLTNFGPGVRGIIDTEGNMFVAQKDGYFNHGNMGRALGFIEGDSEAMYDYLTEWMLVNRIGSTNAFGLADSSYDFASDEYDYHNIQIIADFLRAAKRKNPQYDFYAEYYEDVKGKPIQEDVYQHMDSEEEPTWIVNGQSVGINFFADKYYQWNQGGYESASEKSVLEFLQNNYEDFVNDEKLKHDLYHKLVDNEILDEETTMKNVKYTAVVLDDKSRTALLKRLGNMIPNGWETIAHHMTINLGPIAPEFAKFLGMNVDLKAEEFAADDKVMAVGVSGFATKNAKPHITLAVNRANGGKPMMSNQLTNWQKLSEPLVLSGKVIEVE